ncbi:hypothetical protein [Citrobacter werkmanii]|uniref:hypothetical protein n=1 Tax=Citrobacter werkmanii TaxID=67827 RepID=UPI0037C7554B
MTDYSKNWVAAASDKFRLELMPAQHKVIEAIQEPGAMVSAVATIGMGTSVLYATIVATAYLFNPGMMIWIITDDEARLARVKAEIHCQLIKMFINDGLHHSVASSLANDCIRNIRRKLLITEVDPDCPEELAGRWAEQSLYIIDNAALISDDALAIIRTGLTEEDNRLLMVSEAHRNEGHFYDSHHKLKDLYTTVRSTSKESTLLAPKWFDRVAGSMSPEEYRRSVLGEFPEKTANCG